MVTVTYLERHYKALANPDATEKPIIDLVEFLREFRTNHENNGGKLADDYFVGPAWLGVLTSARKLLNTDLGRLDGGILDSYILEELKEAGFSESDL